MLETAVQRAREMSDLVRTLTRACYQQQECIRQLNKQLNAHTTLTPRQSQRPSDQPLASLSAATRFSLDNKLASDSLYCPISGNARLAVVLNDAHTGRMLDCNQQMCDACDMTVDEMAGIAMNRSYDDLMNDDVRRAKKAAVQYEPNQQKDRRNYLQQTDQYPASLDQVRRLMLGEVDRIDVPWRCDLGTDD